MFLGNFVEDATVYVPWNTNDATGAAVTVSGVLISIYKDDSIVQKTTANGITSSTDFDGEVGSHLISVDTSNDTGDAGFWTTGADYHVHVEATVTGITVRKFVGTFAIENRSCDAISPNAVEWTYTVTSSSDGTPIAGAEVWVTTDAAGTNIVWIGTTDAFGVARDDSGNLPRLDPGTYYVWKQIAGFTDDDNPDTEVVA